VRHSQGTPGAPPSKISYRLPPAAQKGKHAAHA